mmetsp:Transcript_26382/g.47556  ORF Transcript_26382/g.47556 Transcript_26382/m.47556 type:complete len:183 (-) Transcript_26382:74-622(-)|eukprot:CAMPEP_0197654928 /NCGR_PEP_ID=MMETSP1338-20131121/39144_1 /TAXON_ID=43686 ORGANISM="Pelagodinium beii, Strain RCC1491" /NCGR_SAMPLE_ID=MMETSP1338 /ASSEMBLY_ACC=CAM_ASM_000754 /LENGTH=182 /DNA_ID=CAMNT_0043230469 /DNA_START=105 /DNA_END=653 /DNA_ORIENTATION=-
MRGIGFASLISLSYLSLAAREPEHSWDSPARESHSFLEIEDQDYGGNGTSHDDGKEKADDGCGKLQSDDPPLVQKQILKCLEAKRLQEKDVEKKLQARQAAEKKLVADKVKAESLTRDIADPSATLKASEKDFEKVEEHLKDEEEKMQNEIVTLDQDGVDPEDADAETEKPKSKPKKGNAKL